MKHDIKIHPSFFEMVIRGEKKAEIRKNDRPYEKGDMISLREYNREHGYTGRKVDVKVLGVLHESPGMIEGYCHFSFELLTDAFYEKIL